MVCWKKVRGSFLLLRCFCCFRKRRINYLPLHSLPFFSAKILLSLPNEFPNIRSLHEILKFGFLQKHPPPVVFHLDPKSIKTWVFFRVEVWEYSDGQIDVVDQSGRFLHVPPWQIEPPARRARHAPGRLGNPGEVIGKCGEFYCFCCVFGFLGLGVQGLTISRQLGLGENKEDNL